MIRGLAAALLALCALAPTAGAERPVVVVTPGAEKLYRIAVQTFADRSAAPSAERVERFRAAVESALEFSDVFAVLDPKAFLGPRQTGALAGPAPHCGDWRQIGADGLVQGELSVAADVEVSFLVWDTVGCLRKVQKRYRQPSADDLAYLARRVADDIVAAFIGVRGVSATEIAFVSNRKGNPEIYVMDAPGGRQRPATSNRSLNNFPGWSPDGDSIVYTSYRQANRPLLFISTRGRGRPGLLLPSLGTERAQYRGTFAPDGRRLGVVMSAEGQPSEIYLVRADGQGLQRLTRNRSIDIAPAWSPDGRRLAFVSDRTGAPQVYLMNADGSDQRRVSFTGSYNTQPAWSPDGRWLAHESRVGGQFDIWLLEVETGVHFPLVQHRLSDESPTWAPNSRKLAFSSRRRGRADIYTVDVDGKNLRRITQGAGDNTSPSWGPFPR